MNKLKPCPFCGGEAKVESDTWRDVGVMHCVECECGVSTGVYETVEEAVEHWNRRIKEEPTNCACGDDLTVTD